MRVLVDDDTCVGCGVCEETCPEIFTVERNVAVVKIDEDVPEEHLDAVTSAVEDCPVVAISIEG